jgi:hypothetical protein
MAAAGYFETAPPITRALKSGRIAGIAVYNLEGHTLKEITLSNF